MLPQHLILFDVDGTLTEARKPIQKTMLKALRELCRYAEVGFLTGSGLEYIKEQLWPALADPIIRQNCHLLPCNGTEYVIPYGDEEIIFNHMSKEHMIEQIGVEKFNKLMKKICSLQALLLNATPDIPLTGNFVDNRGSTINWCPIGRNALQPDRDTFKALDKLYNIRKTYIQILKNFAEDEKIEITIKLGGNTSFDIFPNGWDKTFALKHFEGQRWNFWFVGDRCSPAGNDYEIFSALKNTGRAFEVGNPEETVEIIDFHILRELGA
jgi:phosphomannomutase|tara:strand:+ start:278 stop:1081 length:804 start_codon:yes stop_codon:yes gene_type:complete